ncbi:MAG: hypothetical protein K1X29_06775 [Bdellovibrionales bacterium]|nr:hypothetical protein [Bdellovibrionales bacterium]
MSTQVQFNWSKLKAELNKITYIERLKTEVQRFGQELRKFDINAHLSPQAKQRLKAVEAKYQEVTKSLGKTQRQLDREMARVLRNFKVQRELAEKGLAFVKTTALEQRQKLEVVGAKLKDRMFQTKSATPVVKVKGKAKTVSKKAPTKKKTTRTSSN